MGHYVFVPPTWSEVSDIVTAVATVASVGAAAYAIRQANQAQESARKERQADSLARRRTSERKIVPVLYAVLSDVRATERRLAQYATSTTYGAPSADEFRLPNAQRLIELESELTALPEDDAARVMHAIERTRVYGVEVTRSASEDVALNPGRLILGNLQVLLPFLIQSRVAIEEALQSYENAKPEHGR